MVAEVKHIYKLVQIAASVEPLGKLQVFTTRDIGVHAWTLRHDPRTLTRLGVARSVDCDSQQAHVPGIRSQRTLQQADAGALAGTVRSEQARATRQPLTSSPCRE